MLRASTLTLLLAAAAAGCGRDPVGSSSADRSLQRAPFTVMTSAGLRHTVSVSDGRVSPGEEFTVRISVENVGGESVSITRRICGFDIRADWKLEQRWPACDGYSMTADLAPGETIEDSTTVAIPSEANLPGAYVLRARLLLDPETWLAVPVRIEK